MWINDPSIHLTIHWLKGKNETTFAPAVIASNVCVRLTTRKRVQSQKKRLRSTESGLHWPVAMWKAWRRVSVPFWVDSGLKCFGCGTRNADKPGLHPTLITSWNNSGPVKFGCDYDWPTVPGLEIGKNFKSPFGDFQRKSGCKVKKCSCKVVQ